MPRVRCLDVHQSLPHRAQHDVGGARPLRVQPRREDALKQARVFIDGRMGLHAGDRLQGVDRGLRQRGDGGTDDVAPRRARAGMARSRPSGPR